MRLVAYLEDLGGTVARHYDSKIEVSVPKLRSRFILHGDDLYVYYLDRQVPSEVRELLHVLDLVNMFCSVLPKTYLKDVTPRVRDLHTWTISMLKFFSRLILNRLLFERLVYTCCEAVKRVDEPCFQLIDKVLNICHLFWKQLGRIHLEIGDNCLCFRPCDPLFIDDSQVYPCTVIVSQGRKIGVYSTYRSVGRNIARLIIEQLLIKQGIIQEPLSMIVFAGSDELEKMSFILFEKCSIKIGIVDLVNLSIERLCNL